MKATTQGETKSLESRANQYRAILDSALDAIITINAAGAIVEFNPAAERMFGWPHAEAVGQQLGDLIVPPALREEHQHGLVRQLAGGTPTILGRRIEISAMRRDGTEFPIELAITHLTHAEPVLFTGFIRDITERKTVQAELEASRNQLQSIMHSIDGIVWEADAQTFQFTFVSEKAERLLGYPIAQWTSDPNFWRSHVHP